MSDRDLTTTRQQVFGDVPKGTECRVCGRNVDDGRAKTCSEYCNNLLVAVMNMLNWSSVRRRIIKRDDEICQVCGFDYSREREARARLRGLIESKLPERPEGPSMANLDAVDEYDWDSHRNRMEERRERREYFKGIYGDPDARGRRLEVDHITPISEGGHPFDPANLQTLCGECHKAKTGRENSERADRQTPSSEDLHRQLTEFVTTGGES